MSQTQDWIREKFAAERGTVEYNNLRLTHEVEFLKERSKQLETDMAYTQHTIQGNEVST